MVKKAEENKVKTEFPLKGLKEKLRKLQTEKADLLQQAEKLKKAAKAKVKDLEKEIKTLRKNVKYLRESLGSSNS